MHVYNEKTGRFERLDMAGYLRELRIRSEVVRTTTDPCESFANGGDFLDMAEANGRREATGREVAA